MSDKISKKEEEILKDLKKNLKNPKSKTKPGVIVAMVGLIGSGRKKVVEEISKKIDAELICADDIRAKLRKSGIGYENVRFMVRELAKEILKEGGSVILDSDYVDPDKRNRLKKIAKDNNVRIYYIGTFCDRDEMIGRIINTSYKKGGFWQGAGSKWKGVKKAAVVKLREMRRRTPHHYTWRKEGGGKWIPKDHTFIFETIDTTDISKVSVQINKMIKKIK